MNSIDWRAFLGRPRLPQPSSQVVDELRQERILVTGAGGSIGSALALRLAGIAPRRLILLESSESALFTLQGALAGAAQSQPPACILGSVQDANLLGDLFAHYEPSLVFHAAAFKHVPLLEEHPVAAIENNVFGTKSLASAAATNGARVVLLSTDKAVEPASIMGATKRVAECIVLGAGGTVLRLGNVLASSNSVAESFARQIAAGGPLTVTDPAARRYFLTIEEAVDLLIAPSGEPEGPVLLAPDLRSPQYVTDLARFMARVLAPDQEISIDFTEPRCGDKELEKLWSSNETAVPAATEGLFSIRSDLMAEAAFDRELGALLSATRARDLPTALSLLRSLVPDFTPSAALLTVAQRSASRVAP
ncbi:MAG TPA: polysaccharide biosynthesis protein [Terracidiphilus sp.]|nr:polysaccharide biosynthesis protein [Terracidiphilus sp.]